MLATDSLVAIIKELKFSIFLSDSGLIASKKRNGSKRYKLFTSPFLLISGVWLLIYFMSAPAILLQEKAGPLSGTVTRPRLRTGLPGIMAGLGERIRREVDWKWHKNFCPWP
ncbi:hypothetical membrane protein [Pelotomaculum thermopropionicum SI]|uniref:Hypothetical membrane protein n=1 Tax=Pelotomaculum thermopropionicum (strain DSM 13744 / JCM 10971 / SI) TaxID=370438 RepID=A5D650_PELTS|nr:hypothetical membrane protein [Pelotomaculum thermopropionicum SI]